MTPAPPHFPDERDPAAARFLVRLCLVGTAVGLIGSAIRHALDPSFSLAIPVGLTLAYVLFAELARRGWFQTAGVLVVLWTTLAALIVGALNHELEPAFVYTALALFVGCTLLPFRSAVAAGVGVILLVLSSAFWPGAPSNPRFYRFVGTVLPSITALMLFAVHHRNRRDRERRVALEASARRLQVRSRYLAFQQSSLLRLTSSEQPNLADAMRIVFQTASEVLEARWMGLALRDGDQGSYRISHAHPERGLGVVLDAREAPAVFEAVSDRRLVAVDGVVPVGASWDVLRRGLLAPLGIEHALVAPVHLDGVVVALLFIGDALAGSAADELLGHELQAASLGDLVSAFIAAERRHETERALMQAQKQEELALLMGGLAHDVNNMLSVVVAQAELLKAQLAKSTPLVVSKADRIRAAALRAGGLVTNLLSFARPQGIRVEAVEAGPILKTFAEFLKPLVGEDVELVVTVDETPAVVQIDRHQLEQIIVNLATNARHAMPKGGRLALALENVTFGERDVDRPTAAPGRYVRLTVSDTGVGIAENILSRIWDPFFTTKRSGSGLGLATVQRIVQQARGHIGVDSKLGQGTTFRVYLPAAPDAAREPSQEIRAPARIVGEHTILVAEDEPPLRQLLQSTFEQLGLQVILAEDGQQAIDVFREHGATISAVVLDVVMPRVGGAEALRQIRRQRKDVRAILMSGYVPDASLAEIGGVAFLRKPFTLDVLSHTLVQVLGAPAN